MACSATFPFNIQRGNNRQVCFAGEHDFAAYANWLKDASKKYSVDIHAWVLMTNHVHLFCTPTAPIELNPVRAVMVEQPPDYTWSSHAINAQGKTSDLCTPHALYLALDKEAKERQANYRELFRRHVEGKLLEEIRQAAN